MNFNFNFSVIFISHIFYFNFFYGMIGHNTCVRRILDLLPTQKRFNSMQIAFRDIMENFPYPLKLVADMISA